MQQKLTILSLWLLASLVATAFAVLQLDSVSVDGSYVLSSNDAFYHARRILDAAIGERGFYQFDNMIHVPEGSWISWPWAYDLAVAGALQLALWLNPAMDPMQFLVYVPVAWIPVNVALLLAICSVLNLRTEFRALVVIGFALLPLTQSLHRIGELDHHFIELTFVLLACWLSLRWLTDANNRWTAACCGIGLGLAHGFHNGLFILQLPLLITIGILWLRSSAPGRQSILTLAASLALTTLIVALFSEPLRDGQFSMSTLSWFHVYVAACSAALLAFMAIRSYSVVSLLMLTGLGVVLAVPVFSEILLGAGFLTGKLFLLDRILEVTSPLRMITGDWGFMNTLGMYSGLLLFVPLLIAVFLFKLLRDQQAVPTAMAVFSIFGLTLLLLQFRLHYFGLPFLLIGPFYLLDSSPWLQTKQRLPIAMASILVFAVVFQPPLRGPLFSKYPLANDHLYEQVHSLFRPLQQRCASNPGSVAAASQFGHYIRFHTDCPVIANNFLLTGLHATKVEEVNGLFYLRPDALRTERPDVRYVLAFLSDAYELVNGTVRMKSLDDIEQRNPPLIVSLFFAPQPAPGFQLIGEVNVDTGGGRKVVLARLYEIEPRTNGQVEK